MGPGSGQEFDLEDFVDLKSVSNYGWRVDIERLRSKYFVDLMRNKENDDKKLDSIIPEDTGDIPAEQVVLMSQIKQIKIEGGGKDLSQNKRDGRGSQLSLGTTPGGAGRPTTSTTTPNAVGQSVLDEFLKSKTPTTKAVHSRHESQKVTLKPPKSSMEFREIRNHRTQLSQPTSITPAPGQYQPKYDSIIKQSHQYVMISKGDRFICKDVFQTWLNRPPISAFSTQTGSRKLLNSSQIGMTTTPLGMQYTMDQWAQNEVIPFGEVGSKKPSHNPKSKSFVNTVQPSVSVSEFDKPQPKKPTSILKLKTSLSRRGQSPVSKSKTPASSLQFDKQIPRKDLMPQTQSFHESRFQNFHPFTPTTKFRFKFVHQVPRPSIVQPQVNGDTTYEYEKAYDKFRYTSQGFAVLFQRETIDYAMKNDMQDMRELMRKRRRERKLFRSRQEVNRYEQEKYVIQDTRW